jgi:hypothetical protein
MTRTRPGFSFDRLEDKVGGIDLAVGVRIGNTDRFAFVFKYQHVIYVVVAAELSILFLPDFKKVLGFTQLKLSERKTVMRAVTNHTRNSTSGLIPVNARWRKEIERRLLTDTGMIIVEYKRARVIVISRAADAQVTRAQVTVGTIIGQRPFFMLQRLAAPRAILTMCRNDYPLFAQRMPTFFPVHILLVRSMVKQRTPNKSTLIDCGDFNGTPAGLPGRGPRVTALLLGDLSPSSLS